MPIRTSGGVFDEQVITGSLAHYVVCGADFSGAINSYGLAVPDSAAEIIFERISTGAYVSIMNPNDCNLSFALEANRSVWDEISLTEMIQSLGNNVGADHIDCSVCTVKQVPYVWGCDTGATSFLELLDTPDTYAGAAGYHVAVNASEDGLVFTPALAGANAFSFISSPTQPTIVAIGADTLNIVAGLNVTVETDAPTRTVTISAAGANDFIPVPGGSALLMSRKYFVTSAGTVTLPVITSANTPGQTIRIAKINSITITVSVGDPGDVISTDLGDTDSIEFDATQELLFVVSDQSTWNLQVGSIN